MIYKGHTSVIILTGILIMSLVVVLTGCGRFLPTAVVPPQGMLFCHYSAPLSTHLDNVPAGRKVTRVSSSSTHYLRDIILTNLDFSWGEAGIQQIARMGGLKQVYFADYDFLNILGVYARFTINVYGSTVDVPQ